MTYSKSHVLLAEDVMGLKADSDSPTPRFFPPNQMDFPHARELTFVLSVAGVSGSPSAWSLNAKFQFCQINTTGSYMTAPRWFDLQTEQVSKLVAEGVGWYGGAHTTPVGGAFGLVADNTDTLPLTVSRTLIGGFGMRVRLLTSPAFTGGTNPRLRLGVTLIEKGL